VLSGEGWVRSGLLGDTTADRKTYVRFGVGFEPLCREVDLNKSAYAGLTGKGTVDMSHECRKNISRLIIKNDKNPKFIEF